MKKLLLVSVVFLSILSCTRLKDITYLRGIGNTTSDSLIKTTYSSYKVQPFDVLYIRISSALNPEAVEMFNLYRESTSSSTIYEFSEQRGYHIDTDGKIYMPVLGNISVDGLTIREIEKNIKLLVSKYVTDADITVRLLSFKVTLLGEVGAGQKTILADRANLLEVFAISGDISRYGNRHNVLILRTTPEGMKSYRVDVTDKNLVSSPLFYVQPNDVIYVEPVKSAALRFSLSDLALVLSTITTFASIYFLVLNISK